MPHIDIQILAVYRITSNLRVTICRPISFPVSVVWGENQPDSGKIYSIASDFFDKRSLQVLSAQSYSMSTWAKSA